MNPSSVFGNQHLPISKNYNGTNQPRKPIPVTDREASLSDRAFRTRTSPTKRMATDTASEIYSARHSPPSSLRRIDVASPSRKTLTRPDSSLRVTVATISGRTEVSIALMCRDPIQGS